MCLIHTNLPPSTAPHPPRHLCLLFPILIFHTRSVMCSNHIAATRESSQGAHLAGFFCIKPSAWARLWCVADFGGSEGGLSPLFYSLFSICLCNQRVQRKEKSSNDCFCCFSQHNKLGLNRVRDDRVTQQFVSAHPLQHAKNIRHFCASSHKLFRLLVMTSSFSCTIFSDIIYSPFWMVCRNFHSTRVCKLCLFQFAQFIVLYPEQKYESCC